MWTIKGDEIMSGADEPVAKVYNGEQMRLRAFAATPRMYQLLEKTIVEFKPHAMSAEERALIESIEGLIDNIKNGEK